MRYLRLDRAATPDRTEHDWGGRTAEETARLLQFNWQILEGPEELRELPTRDPVQALAWTHQGARTALDDLLGVLRSYHRARRDGVSP